MDEGQRRTYSYSERGVSRDAARHVPTNDGTMLQKAPGSESTAFRKARPFGGQQKSRSDFCWESDHEWTWILAQIGNIHESNLISNQITFIYALRRL